MSRAVIIGAGKTGRGFIARLLYEAGADILFIDKNKELVDNLNRLPFEVSFFGEIRPSVRIDGYRAVTWEEAEIRDDDVIFVSVGGTNLSDVGVQLDKLIGGREMRIIVCENAISPAVTLKKAIKNSQCVFVAEATVFCTTVENGKIGILSENYPYLQFDADAFSKGFPEIKGIVPVKQFEHFLTRKLYTYNAASCVIAYLGHLKGYTLYSDAANDTEILSLIDKNYADTNSALCQEFGYDKEDQEQFALLSRKKFCDRSIADDIARNAREPQRKMGADERIMGPLRLIEKYGGDTGVLEKTLAAMLLYENEGEKEWQNIKKQKTFPQILTEICGIESGSELMERILRYAANIQENQI